MAIREELEMRSHMGTCLLPGLGGILLAAVVGAVPFGGALPLLLVGGWLPAAALADAPRRGPVVARWQLQGGRP
jgi:hypothetical protein